MSEPRVYNKWENTPHDAVYIGRGSPWGNPFRISFAQDRATVIERFRCEVLPTLDVRPLIGKSLICFCAPKPCHGDVLLEAAAKAAVAETDSRDSSECPPRAVFADPDPAPPAGGR